MKLSVIIPYYNEVKTIREVLERVIALNIDKEIVLVDDGSTDGTSDAIADLLSETIRLVVNKVNMGKGGAICKGISLSSGDIVAIQDADLEYSPEDLPKLLEAFKDKKVSAVYGIRPLHLEGKRSYHRYYWGGRLTTLITNCLYGMDLKDAPTGYKLLRRSVIQSLNLNAKGFDFCAEVNAKLGRGNHLIRQMPINYFPRSFEEGKKIRFYDGIEAVWTLIKYRFVKNF